MTDAWKEYAADFSAMTDSQVDDDCKEAQKMIDEGERFVEAVAAWIKAGRPREDIEPTEDDRIAELERHVDEWKFASEAMAKADREKAARIAALEAKVKAAEWLAEALDFYQDVLHTFANSTTYADTAENTLDQDGGKYARRVITAYREVQS